eukprot:jgi/Hompol1/3009/HPOL_006290-RA
MTRIDESLLRRRSEHNDGELSTLQEVSLHQFDIEKIENLDVYCRNLQILYLQSNQISKIENLQKLKSLKYLQLALNNITVIENLEGCESLEKLDLTVNFVKDLHCVEALKANIHLKELFLVGNPCTQIEGYRHFVIHTLPQLKSLDSVDIEKSERIIAAQEYPRICRNLHQIVLSSSLSTDVPSSDVPQQEPRDSIEQSDDLDQIRDSFQTKPVPHTPEARLAAARDLAKLREAKDGRNVASKAKPAKDTSIYFAPDGRVLQKNEGKYPFKWTDNSKCLTLTVEISKFLDSSMIDVDVHPTWLRVTIKGKILQLLTEEEVKTSNVICERSKLTGQLAISMLKASAGNADVAQIKQKDPMVSTSVSASCAAKAAESRPKSRFGPTIAGLYDIVNGSNTSKKQSKTNALSILDSASISADRVVDENFVDDPSVPALI